MTVTADDLTGYVSPDVPLSGASATYAAGCLATAAGMIATHTGIPETVVNGDPGDMAGIPATVLDRAVLEVAAELFHRRQAPNGISQFATPDGGGAIRVARDPMVAAYALLGPYVGRGIG